jgi:hypothetical protein
MENVRENTFNLDSPEVTQATGNPIINNTCKNQGHSGDNYTYKKSIEKETPLLIICNTIDYLINETI